MADRKVCTSCVKWCGDLYCFWRSPNLVVGPYNLLWTVTVERMAPPWPVIWAEPPLRLITIEQEPPRAH